MLNFIFSLSKNVRAWTKGWSQLSLFSSDDFRYEYFLMLDYFLCFKISTKNWLDYKLPEMKFSAMQIIKICLETFWTLSLFLASCCLRVPNGC